MAPFPAADRGYFGPDSITWQVNQEMTVLFGGARALLMHAAHPLVAAGARQTSMYQRDPWARLLRTLQLQSTMTFGTQVEADQAADRINRLHRKVNGVDPITGERYDALDPDLLLWVHACLEESSLLFFQRTVRPLSSGERDRYHQENLLAADLMLLPRDRVPVTFSDLSDYVEEMISSGRLMMTEVAANVAEIIRRGPVPAIIKPIWGLIRFAAFGTLPPDLRRLYGVRWSAGRERWLDRNLAGLRRVRPILPLRYRMIGPARWASERLAGKHNLTLAEAGARRGRGPNQGQPAS
ncbi:MAG: oxygenase MpaB family protein [Actinomycetota bacterium]